MPRHNGWAAMLLTGRLIGSTFSVIRTAAMAKAMDCEQLLGKPYKIVRVKFVAADPPRRDR